MNKAELNKRVENFWYWIYAGVDSCSECCIARKKCKQCLDNDELVNCIDLIKEAMYEKLT